jgi:hypothetical protein
MKRTLLFIKKILFKKVLFLINIFMIYSNQSKNEKVFIDILIVQSLLLFKMHFYS